MNRWSRIGFDEGWRACTVRMKLHVGDEYLGSKLVAR